MKKKFIVVALIVVMLILVVASSPGITGLEKGSVSKATNTPVPAGQIDIPAVKVQLYVPGPNPLENTANLNNQTAGFIIGLFHGFISPGTLLVSFFNADVQMYEVHNKGGFYNLGFLLGAAVIFGFMGLVTGRRHH